MLPDPEKKQVIYQEAYGIDKMAYMHAYKKTRTSDPKQP